MTFLRPCLLLGSLAAVMGCSFPVDDFVTQRVGRDDATTDSLDVADASAVDAAREDTAKVDDTATPKPDTATPDTVELDTAKPDTAKPDTTAPDTTPPTDSSSTCTCVDCPGESHKCKAYDPPGCGVFNDPC